MNLILAIMLLLMPVNSVAQDKLSDSDPFDISSTVKKTKELGIPTVSEVDSLEKTARQLFKAGKCAEAIPALEEYARKANWIANLISSGLGPYYGASYDDRKGYPDEKLQPLVPYENMANKYKHKRNISIAMQGECLAKYGEVEKSVSYLVKALDLLNIEDEYWWNRTRSNLYAIIGVK